MTRTATARTTTARTDATPAYYTQATRPAKAATPARTPAEAALDLMFGYYDQH